MLPFRFLGLGCVASEGIGPIHPSLSSPSPDFSGLAGLFSTDMLISKYQHVIKVSICII